MEDSLSVAEEGQEPEGSNEEDRSGSRCTERKKERERGQHLGRATRSDTEGQGAIERDVGRRKDKEPVLSSGRLKREVRATRKEKRRLDEPTSRE